MTTTGGSMANDSTADQFDVRELRAEVERLRQWQKEMVEIQASGGRLDGYRELAAKCAGLEERAERAEAALAVARKDAELGWSAFYALRKTIADDKYPHLTNIVRALAQKEMERG